MARTRGANALAEDERDTDYEPEPERGPLSAREAKKLVDPLADLIVDAGEWANRGLKWVSITQESCDAFSFTDDEAEKLAKIWLGRAKKSAIAARMTLALLDQWDVWETAALLFGRFLDAADYLRENGVRRPSVPAWVRPARFRRGRAAARPADSQQPDETAAISHSPLAGHVAVAYTRDPAAAAATGSPSGKRRVVVSQAQAEAQAEQMQAAAAARAMAARAPLQFAAPDALAGSAPDEVIAAIIEAAAEAEPEEAQP